MTKYINPRSKVNHPVTNYFIFSDEHRELLGLESRDEDVGKVLTRINEYDIKNVIPDIKRGDLIAVFDPDRNDGIFIYDGTEVGELAYNVRIDEYGYIPSTFTIDEFCPLYWVGPISHNSYIWFKPNLYNFQSWEKVHDKIIKVKSNGIIFFFCYIEKKGDTVELFQQFLAEKATNSTPVLGANCADYFVDVMDMKKQLKDMSDPNAVFVEDNGKYYKDYPSYEENFRYPVVLDSDVVETRPFVCIKDYPFDQDKDD